MNRQLLAKIDRRLLSELDHTDGVQLVKVPVSDAMWCTWRRYCDTADVPMGRGLAILLQHELASVVDVDLDELGDRLTAREASIASREAELDDQAQELERRERAVAFRERRLADVEASGGSMDAWKPPKRGRNEPCWCDSGKKYKYCHGRTAT